MIKVHLTEFLDGVISTVEDICKKEDSGPSNKVGEINVDAHDIQRENKI
jgi:hypothetical protein